MVLGFCREFPDTFDALDFSKAVQPRLLAMLRYICCHLHLPDEDRLWRSLHSCQYKFATC